MSVLPDWMIRARRELPRGDPRRLVIEPFVDYGECPAGVISYGLSSGGYDLRVANCFLMFMNTAGIVVDPKKFRREAFAEVERAAGDQVIIPPNCFCLAETVEYLEIPRDCIVQVVGKSTPARAGYVLPLTPFEPGWRGTPTLEIGNLSPLPMAIYAGEGIGQMLYHALAAEPERDYGQKPRPAYQDQQGLTPPRVAEAPPPRQPPPDVGHWLQYAYVGDDWVAGTEGMDDGTVRRLARRPPSSAEPVERFDRCPACQAWTRSGGPLRQLRRDLDCPAVRHAVQGGG